MKKEAPLLVRGVIHNRFEVDVVRLSCRFSPAWFLFLLLAHLRIVVWAAPESALSARQVAAVDAAMRAQMQKQRVVGLAVGVIQNGGIVYLNGYGWADAQHRVPVGPQTLFRWASISKTLTAVAALQLVEAQKLDLNADVRAYVPEFPDKGAAITSRQLLCHQSGLPHYSNGKVIKTQRDYSTKHPFEDVVLALDTFKESPLLFPPGEKFSYSTYAYILLSAVVQRAGKQGFSEQVEQRIAASLGMTTLQPDYEWKPVPNRAVGYTVRGEQVVASTDTDVSWKLGGGGWVSNIEDFARFAQGLVRGRLLSPQTYDLMWQPQRTATGELTGWGLGFAVQNSARTGLKVWHEGRQEKARCRMVLYPQRGSAVVVMTNSDYADPGAFSTAVYAALKP